MSQISTDIIKKAVYELCYKANTCLDEGIYSKIFTAYENATNIDTKDLLKTILQNAKIAYEKKLLIHSRSYLNFIVSLRRRVLLWSY